MSDHKPFENEAMAEVRHIQEERDAYVNYLNRRDLGLPAVRPELGPAFSGYLFDHPQD